MRGSDSSVGRVVSGLNAEDEISHAWDSKGLEIKKDLFRDSESIFYVTCSVKRFGKCSCFKLFYFCLYVQIFKMSYRLSPVSMERNSF